MRTFQYERWEKKKSVIHRQKGGKVESPLFNIGCFYYYSDCARCDLTKNPAGFMPDPCNCDDYYQCVMRHGMWVAAYHMSCPNCTCFSPDSLVCENDPNANRDLCPATSVEDEEIIVTTGGCCI